MSRKTNWIYICHPFTTYGDPEANFNIQAKICAEYDLKLETPISPILTFGKIFSKDREHHALAMEACFRLLSVCDACHVFGDWEQSVGCMAEVEWCMEKGMPVVFYKVQQGSDGKISLHLDKRTPMLYHGS